ncbi:MAG: hypothetical protein E7653_06340 [Ruminococcaceae bacterium]|nr:hypothetical protein [Oscillospiraceae bacterium]
MISDIIRELDGDEIEVTIEKKLSIPTFVEGYKKCYMQGGGTNGKYAYYIINEGGNTGEELSRMYKIDLETWEIVAQRQGFKWAHANDVTYDSKRGVVVVCHCNKRISFVDPDTLEELEVRELTTGGQYSMAYNAKRDQYAIGKSLCYDIGITNSDFELIKTYEGQDGYTKQGMECDDEFIYFFHTGKRNNWIWVYDWDGNYLKKFTVPMVGESENLFIRGDKFIAAFNNFKDQTGDIYEMTLTRKPKKSKTIPEIIRDAGSRELEAILEKKLVLPTAIEGFETCAIRGGASDGTYAYYSIAERVDADKSRTKLVKVDTQSWTVVAKSEALSLGKATDIAYDPNKNLLVVTHGDKNASFVNADTLEVVETRELEIRVIQYGIAYDKKNERFIVGNSGYDSDVFDKDWGYVKRLRGLDGYVRHGMECDNKYIYFLQSNTRHNWLWVYDWDGDFVKKIAIPKVASGANLFIKDDKFIITFDNSREKTGDVYEMTLVEKN